jgi:two-component system, chemotaxis family, protein-glutamate methylesterase/glutaminase
MKPIRVLVVDDSASMRGLICATLSRDPAILVVGQAADPIQAREAIKALDPDVMTLDVEMPKMNGLEFLDKVMRLRPFPVIMVSSLTERGAGITISAMEIGAVDCIAKPTLEHPDSFKELAGKVKSAATARMGNRIVDRRSARPHRNGGGGVPNGSIVAIGASTGGVEAILAILSDFPPNCPPTLITLHLPAPFTKTFVERLNRHCAPHVEEAVHGAPIIPGNIYVAPGTVAHLEVGISDRLHCQLRTGDLINGHRPSVDALFHSVAKAAGSKSVGVILTGMGGDGAKGLLALRQCGGRTLGQDESTSVVYGMPRVAAQLGAVQKQLPLEAIAAEIATLTTTARIKG